MRIVFFGTPDFATESLKHLVENNVNVVAAVTAPDKPSGRGLQLQTSSVKQYCLEHNIKLLQPISLKEQTFLEELKALKADLNIVVAFRMLPEQVWNMPHLGTYNLHASLLPKYRGAAPINWCIINGDKETGVTTFKLQHQIDTGNILFYEKAAIDENMTAGNLHDKLMQIGAKLLLKTIIEIEKSVTNGTELKFISQNENLVSHAPKLTKEICKINWSLPVHQIHNFIRGLSPYPGAHTNLNNDELKPKSLKIFSSNYFYDKINLTNGSLITDNKSYLKVICSDGVLEIKELQLEGKKRMSVVEFLKGYKFKEGAFLSS